MRENEMSPMERETWDEAVVICEVCKQGKVSEPASDYCCHGCGRKLCKNCIESSDFEHGFIFCLDCDADLEEPDTSDDDET